MKISDVKEVESIVAEVRVEMRQQGVDNSLTMCKFEQEEVDQEKLTKRIVGWNLKEDWELTLEVYKDCKRIKAKFRSLTMNSLSKDIKDYFDNVYASYPNVRTWGWDNRNIHHQYLEKEINIRANKTKVISDLVLETKYILDNVL
ncbi:MAG: hypothetical protein KID02_03950 [Clostridiales bacterium]|nr:hypothetical protein [Clostridiales bacterium]